MPGPVPRLSDDNIAHLIRLGFTTAEIMENKTTALRITRVRKNYRLKLIDREARRPAWLNETRSPSHGKMPPCSWCGGDHIKFHVCRPLADHKAKLERERLSAERERAPLMIHGEHVKLFNAQPDNQYREAGGNLWLKDPPPLTRHVTLPNMGGE